jgi:hypothetical protein
MCLDCNLLRGQKAASATGLQKRAIKIRNLSSSYLFMLTMKLSIGGKWSGYWRQVHFPTSHLLFSLFRGIGYGCQRSTVLFSSGFCFNKTEGIKHNANGLYTLHILTGRRSPTTCLTRDENGFFYMLYKSKSSISRWPFTANHRISSCPYTSTDFPPGAPGSNQIMELSCDKTFKVRRQYRNKSHY